MSVIKGLKNIEAVLDKAKIENSGLIDLLVQSDQIRQFGRDRFKNEESVKASAGKVVRRRQRYSLASKLG
jgi:hypothetical protein